MTEKKKMGRPSQGKGWKSFSLDQEIIDFLNNLPPGERSRFVNEAVAKEIAELTFADNLRSDIDEQTNVPQIDSRTGKVIHRDRGLGSLQYLSEGENHE